MKTVGYIRVSTGDQANSLEIQKKKIQDYCSYKGVFLEQIIIDEDVSGGKPFYSRPGGGLIYQMIQGGESFNIISIKPDRMFRNVLDALAVVDEWTRREVSMHFIDVGGVSLETTTAIGRMLFTTLIMISEFEKNLCAERTKAVLQHKKKSGKVYCGDVYGYDKIDGKLVINSSEQGVISKIMGMKDSFNSNQIAGRLNNMGHRTKTGKEFMCSTIKTIIKNNEKVQA